MNLETIRVVGVGVTLLLVVVLMPIFGIRPYNIIILKKGATDVEIQAVADSMINFVVIGTGFLTLVVTLAVGISVIWRAKYKNIDKSEVD